MNNYYSRAVPLTLIGEVVLGKAEMSNYNIIFYNVFPEDVIKIIYRYNLSRKIFLDTIWDIKVLNYKFPLRLYPIEYRGNQGDFYRGVGDYECGLEQWINWESYLDSINKKRRKIIRRPSKCIKYRSNDINSNRLGWRCPETGIPMSEEYKNNFNINNLNETRMNYAFTSSIKYNYYKDILKDDELISPSLQIGKDNKKNVYKKYKYYTMTEAEWEDEGQWLEGDDSD